MATSITNNLWCSSCGTGFRKHTSAEALRVCARTPVGPVSWPVQERKPHLHNVMHCKTGALFSVCRFGVQILSYIMDKTCNGDAQQTSAAQAHADNQWPQYGI